MRLLLGVCGALGLLGTALAAAPATGEQPAFSGGDGSELAQSVVVHAATESAGIHAEHAWVNEHLPGGKFGQQSLLQVSLRAYDKIEVLMPDGTTHTVYFDISEFFGKL